MKNTKNAKIPKSCLILYSQLKFFLRSLVKNYWSACSILGSFHSIFILIFSKGLSHYAFKAHRRLDDAPHGDGAMTGDAGVAFRRRRLVHMIGRVLENKQ